MFFVGGICKYFPITYDVTSNMQQLVTNNHVINFWMKFAIKDMKSSFNQIVYICPNDKNLQL